MPTSDPGESVAEKRGCVRFTFTMGASNHPNHPVLARRLHAYPRWRNANARHPDILAAQ